MLSSKHVDTILDLHNMCLYFQYYPHKYNSKYHYVNKAFQNLLQFLVL
nr:MAG TPA: hypothetical protein [Caudoviricetes sp.]